MGVRKIATGSKRPCRSSRKNCKMAAEISPKQTNHPEQHAASAVPQATGATDHALL